MYIPSLGGLEGTGMEKLRKEGLAGADTWSSNAWTKPRWDFHFSYYAVFSADVRVRRNRDGFNGTYESYASLISLSLDYRF